VFLQTFVRRTPLRAAAVLCALTALAVTGPAVLAQAAKKPVHSAADLPRFTYAVASAPSELLQVDAATFAAFATPVGADVDAVLAGYDISDRPTLRDLLGEKLDLELLSGRQDAAALQTAQQIRALEDKPDAKLLAGLSTQAIVAARAESGATSGDAYRASFRKHYAELLAPLPWNVVRSSLQDTRMTYELVTPAILIGQLHGNADPAAEKTHAVDGNTARAIVQTRFVLDVLVPLKADGAAVIADLAARNSVAKPDIWAARDVTLTANDKLTPVRVAVWDSGSDVTLFAHQLFTDPKPGPYDPHGLAFDLLGFPAHGYLRTLTPAQRAAYPQTISRIEGLSDVEQSIDSPAAEQVRREIGALAAPDVPHYLELLEAISDYAHGTHVAGIALRGNPAARLVVARLEYDYKTIPTPPTADSERRSAADVATYARYFRSHGVRVVNMSFGENAAGIESVLEKNGIGADAAARKKLAATYFAIDRAALYDAIKSSPNIVFVCSAGNSDTDASFAEQIPAAFDLPNLLVVGAVDQAGDETNFTSYGKTVKVNADGFQVLSYVPGGARVRLSGTSMSSPNVANLAAKLLALDPALTPERTIALIRRGATDSADRRRHNIDPRRSVELLRRELARR
jgi:subtilisin family serine protease